MKMDAISGLATRVVMLLIDMTIPFFRGAQAKAEVALAPCSSSTPVGVDQSGCGGPRPSANAQQRPFCSALPARTRRPGAASQGRGAAPGPKIALREVFFSS
jgi:hypothetical protein